jgi:hypothetical protein
MLNEQGLNNLSEKAAGLKDSMTQILTRLSDDNVNFPCE